MGSLAPRETANLQPPCRRRADDRRCLRSSSSTASPFRLGTVCVARGPARQLGHWRGCRSVLEKGCLRIFSNQQRRALGATCGSARAAAPAWRRMESFADRWPPRFHQPIDPEQHAQAKTDMASPASKGNLRLPISPGSTSFLDARFSPEPLPYDGNVFGFVFVPSAPVGSPWTEQLQPV